MSQNINNSLDSTQISGTQLTEAINNSLSALLSNLSGNSRPSQIVQGGQWVDTSIADYLVLKVFNGTVDTEIYRVQISTGNLIFAKETDSNRVIGQVTTYASNTPPSGWLICNGQAISRTSYSDLFAIIGITFGDGDGVSTFQVPNLMGKFVRSISDDASNDPDGPRNIGSEQSDAYKAHKHNTVYGGTANNGNNSIATGTNMGESNYQYSLRSHSSEASSWWTSTEGSSETRPINVALAYIIRT